MSLISLSQSMKGRCAAFADTQASKRRSHKKQKELSIGMVISEAGVSIAVVDASSGRPVLHTRNVKFVPETPHRGSFGATKQLRHTLESFTEEFGLAGQSVSVAIGGRSCVTRTVVGPNESVDRQIREIQLRSNRYLGLGSGEKTFAVAQSVIDAKRKRGWVTVADRPTIAAIVEAADHVNLRIDRIEHNLASACELLNDCQLDHDFPALFVENSSGRTRLGISFQGQLLLDYCPISDGQTDAMEWVTAIARHIKCLRRYLQLQVSTNLAQLDTVVLIGQELPAPEITDSLKRLCDVKALSLPIQTINGSLSVGVSTTLPGEVAVATWLARSKGQIRESHSADLVHAVRPKVHVTAKLLVETLWPIAATLLIGVGLFSASLLNQNRLVANQAECDVLSPARIQALANQQELEKFYRVQQNIAALQTAVPPAGWSEIIETVGQRLPADTWLDSITIDCEQAITISGASLHEQRIYDYVKTLDDARLLQTATLQATKESWNHGRHAFEFEITAMPTSLPANVGIASSPTVVSRVSISSTGSDRTNYSD